MKKYLTYPVLLLLWVLIVHSVTVRNTYNIDDTFVVENNTQIQKGFSALPEIFSSFYVQKEKMTFYYRPIPKAVYAMEYEFFGNNPHLFHFVQIMLFALFIHVLWLFLTNVFNQQHNKKFFYGLLLFAAFPTNTEVVASLKNIDIVLSGLFVILSLYYLLQFNDKKKWWYLIPAVLLFFLSVISKQDGLLYGLCGILIFIQLRKKNRLLNTLILIFFILGSYYLYKQIISSLGEHERVISLYENPLFGVKSRIVRITTGLGIIQFYVFKLLIPYPLGFYYGYKILDVYRLGDIQVWIGLLFILSGIGFAIYNLKRSKELSFLLLGLSGSLLFYSNIMFAPLAGMVADRYLFVPSLFFLITLSFLLFKSNRNNANMMITFFAILIIYAGVSIKRDTEWKNRNTLYAHDIGYLKNSVKANEIYATQIVTNINNSVRAGKNIQLLQDSLQIAVHHFNKAIKLFPYLYASHSHLGMINMVFYKNYPEAAHHFEESIKLKTNFIGPKEESELYYHYGYCLMQMQQYEKAIKEIAYACELDSTNLKSYMLWSSALISKKYFDKAIEINKYLIFKNFANEEPYVYQGMCYYEKGEKQRGIPYFIEALKRQSKNKIAKKYLFVYYDSIGKTDSANYYLNH